MIRLALYKARGNLFDRLIRIWTGSIYSHCELVMPDGRFMTSSPRDGGVRTKVIDQDPDTWDFIDLPGADQAQIEALFKRLDGAGYDWLGIVFCQILPFGLNSHSRWFCSEICAHALGYPDPASYSPGRLAKALSAGAEVQP